MDLGARAALQLASLVPPKGGDNGSMGDLARIAYEDLIYYRLFDESWSASVYGQS